MAHKAPIVTRDFLKGIPLPVYSGTTYTVISHDDVVTLMLDYIDQKGLVVVDHHYKVIKGGNVASGVYHIKQENDPELGLMVGWLNSYDKSIKFSCTVGGYNRKYSNYYLSGDISTWTRKHTGSADLEAKEQIVAKIDLADQYYNNIVKDRAMMRNYPVNSQLRGSVLGYLYFEKRILSTDQAAKIMNLMKDPTVQIPLDSMWDLYNYITLGIRDFNPSKWIVSQTKIRNILLNDYMMPLMPKTDNDEEMLKNQGDLFKEVQPEVVSSGETDFVDFPIIEVPTEFTIDDLDL